MHKQLSSSSHNSKATKQPLTFHIASSHNKFSQQVVTNIAKRFSKKEFKQKLEVQTSKVHQKFQWNLQA